MRCRWPDNGLKSPQCTKLELESDYEVPILNVFYKFISNYGSKKVFFWRGLDIIKWPHWEDPQKNLEKNAKKKLIGIISPIALTIQDIYLIILHIPRLFVYSLRKRM